MKDTVIVAEELAKEWIEEFCRILLAAKTHPFGKGDWTGFRSMNVDDLSSAISVIRYNKKGKVLEIKFKERGTYQYSGVPEKLVADFLEAKSKGKFLNKRIKDRFNYKRVASQNRKIKIASQLSRSNFVGRMLAKQGMLKTYEDLNHRRLSSDSQNTD